MTDPILHLTGPILTGPETTADEAWCVDGRLTFTRPDAGSREVVELAGTVVPGLADLHCHIGLDAHGAISDEATVEQALVARHTGVLLTRDCGLPRDTVFLKERDDLPKTIRAGRHLARPKRYMRNYAYEIEPDQLVEYMTSQAQAGDGWVKILGDWIDRDKGDLDTCWPVEVLAEGVKAAHDHGARVTAHCFAEHTLHDMADAGIDCVEHASGLMPDTAERFAEQGIAIVPTLINIDNFTSYAHAGEAKFPQYAAHMRALRERRYDTYQMAHEAGVPIFLGTDAGGVIAHGRVVDEVLELEKVMGRSAALAATTWAARDYLGRPGLEEGAPADLVVLAGDPREDLRALGGARTVVLNGAVVEKVPSP